MISGLKPEFTSQSFPQRGDHRSVEQRLPARSAAARKVNEILECAGIRIGGNRPWDVQVHDSRLFERIMSEGTLAAGESYMDGWWDVEALDEFFARLNSIELYEHLAAWSTAWLAFKGRLLNRQSKWHAGEVAHRHYDLGNDLYEAMLDKRMQYTCAYWKAAGNLDQAQENKMRLVCAKLHLEPGMRVLELGGGFGGLAHFMATEYGCEVVSYNISREQVAYARELCARLPVRIEEKDYREAAKEPEPFDRVVSVGLCEHIGYKNYGRFLSLARAQLKPRGLCLLHTIGSNESVTSTDAWIEKYIFPNGMVPSIAQLGKAMERRWVVEDWHNFGPDYDKTLLAWWSNFDRAWPKLRDKYGDRFYRMWKFYLLGCAGRFRARRLQLWQIVLSKGDVAAYTPVR